MTGLPPGLKHKSVGCQLITIPVSHYCEKARWALDHCGVSYTEQGHFPMFHAIAVRRAGGEHSVPLLKTNNGSIQGSSAIAAWADSFAPGTLIPRKSSARNEALEWQRCFDDELGRATRLWVYHHLLPKRRELLGLMSRGTPSWQRSLFTTGYPMIAFMMRSGMNITALTAQDASRTIHDIFDRVAQRLEDGRPYLVQRRFSIADLAFAALSAPVLLPEQHPTMLDAEDVFDRQAIEQIRIWRDSSAGRFALRLYVTMRH